MNKRFSLLTLLAMLTIGMGGYSQTMQAGFVGSALQITAGTSLLLTACKMLPITKKLAADARPFTENFYQKMTQSFGYKRSFDLKQEDAQKWGAKAAGAVYDFGGKVNGWTNSIVARAGDKISQICATGDDQKISVVRSAGCLAVVGTLQVLATLYGIKLVAKGLF